MLDIKDLEHLKEVYAFATREGVADKLLENLKFLSAYAGPAAPVEYDKWDAMTKLAWVLNYENPNASCELYKDFAPYSFEFLMKKPDGSRWFNGGLIYSGPGQRLDGGFPALTVGIGIDDSVHGWSVHT